MKIAYSSSLSSSDLPIALRPKLGQAFKRAILKINKEV